MKAIFVLLAIVGLSWSAPKPRDLSNDLQDFLDFLPLLEIQRTFTAHLQDDGALVDVVKYLQGPEWHNLGAEIGAKPEVQSLVEFLTKNGIPVGDILAYLDQIFRRAKFGTDPDPTKSLKPFLDDIAFKIPSENVVGFVGGKLTNSEDLQKFFVKISSEDVHKLADEVLSMDEVQHLKEKLIQMEVPIQDIVTAVYDLFGWGKPQVLARSRRSLTDDFNDLLEIIPFEQITAIENEHLKSDGAFVDVVQYLQGQEWHDFVDQVLNLAAVKTLIDDFTKDGFPINEIFAAIDSAVLKAKAETVADPNGSLTSFVKDVQKAVPLTTLLAFINDKLQNSPDVQKLYVRISSEAIKTTAEEILKLDLLKYLATRLIELGLNVQSVFDFIYDFLGWGKAPKLS